MSRVTRVLAITVGAVLVLVLGSGFIVAGTVVTSGLVTVSVHESGPDGLDLYIPVPAGLVEAALSLAPIVLNVVGDHHADRELERVRAELDELMPAITAALDELDDMPDATLVEVEGDHEYVRVRKVRGTIEVQVLEDDTRILISVPTKVFRAVGGFLAG